MADRIDRMLDALREALPEITWDRDAVSEDAELETGAVELTDSQNRYADGKRISEICRIDIWVCVNGSGTAVKSAVEDVLEELGKADDFAWSRPQRNYAYDLDQVVWRWRCECIGLKEIPDPDPEDDGDDAGDDENEDDNIGAAETAETEETDGEPEADD